MKGLRITPTQRKRLFKILDSLEIWLQDNRVRVDDWGTPTVNPAMAPSTLEYALDYVNETRAQRVIAVV
jgi:hypothetical protein